MTIRLGTRGSQLALFQARMVAGRLQDAGVTCEIVVIRTTGDRLAEAPLSQVGGKRLFVKELEDALCDDTIDIAVHSSKDMPGVLPDGLVIGAVLPREEARDALVLPAGAGGMTIETARGYLGDHPRIGTSSVRRRAQLAGLFPNARFTPVRGNLDTRLRKLDGDGFDALVLAAAGLRRLQQADRISLLIPVEVCVPAPGQGIVAVETRSDRDIQSILGAIDDADASAALQAERAVVTRLGGGCQMPIGAHATLAGADLEVTAVVLSLDGSRVVRAVARGSAATAHSTGTSAADQLLAHGAGEILEAAQRAHASVEGLQP